MDTSFALTTLQVAQLVSAMPLQSNDSGNSGFECQNKESFSSFLFFFFLFFGNYFKNE